MAQDRYNYKAGVSQLQWVQGRYEASTRMQGSYKVATRGVRQV